MPMRRFLALAGLILAASALATDFPEGRVQVSDLRGKAKVDGLLRFHLQPGWHVYWLHPGDAGYPPSLKIGTDSVKLAFPLPHRYDLGADVWALGYSDSVAFPFHADRWQAGDSLRAKFLVCKESCLPRVVSLVPEAGDTAGLGQILSRLPAPGGRPVARLAGSAKAKELWVGFPGHSRDTGAVLYAAVPDDWHGSRPLGSRVTGDTLWLGVALQPYADSAARSLHFLGAAGPWKDGSAWQDSAVATSGNAPVATSGKTSGASGLWIALLMGLLGGLLLNLMPCVLPVLALKALSVTRLSQEERRFARLSGVATTFGILVGLMALASVVVGLRAFGVGVGWGGQFQEPRYVGLLAALMVLFGVNLLGLFEFRVPGFAVAKSRSRLFGEFLQGLLAVALSTPCSAPVLGSAIGYGLSQTTAVVYAVFLAIGLGLSLPYLALAAFPSVARLLPRPGEWMEVLRRILSLPMFATALWLLWVLGAQMERGSHLRFQFALLAVAAVAGWIGWAQRRGKFTWERVLWGLLIAAFVAGTWLARPAQETPSRGAWLEFSPARLDSLQAAGIPTLVEGTADWCLSCKVNESHVLRDGTVEDELQRHHVALLRADWTRRDSAFGNWMAAQGRHAVPFAALFVPGAPADLWPELLSRGSVLEKLRALPSRP